MNDLDRAVELFVAAVGPRRTHSGGTYTEGLTKYIVESLLAAGWKPPAETDVLTSAAVHGYSVMTQTGLRAPTEEELKEWKRASPGTS